MFNQLPVYKLLVLTFESITYVFYFFIFFYFLFFFNICEQYAEKFSWSPGFWIIATVKPKSQKNKIIIIIIKEEKKGKGKCVFHSSGSLYIFYLYNVCIFAQRKNYCESYWQERRDFVQKKVTKKAIYSVCVYVSSSVSHDSG